MNIPDLWKGLANEAEESRTEMIPSCVLRDMAAPDGYKAQLCMKRMSVYHRAFEVKGRGVITNTTTGEVCYETGQWASERTAKQGLQRALSELFELAAYREAMRRGNRPTVDSGALA